MENEICLGQYKVEGKSNEITTIPELLDLVDVGGAIVTIGAMGTHKGYRRKDYRNRRRLYLCGKG